MRQQYDIFKRSTDGSPILIESCASFSEARERLEKISHDRPGNYFIYSEPKVAVEVVIHDDAREEVRDDKAERE
jgi:hypothetical protein